MVDGATAVTANMSAASIIPTIDAIAEIKVITNSLAAEFGRSGGAVLNAIYKNPGGRLEKQGAKTQESCGYTDLVVPPMGLP